MEHRPITVTIDTNCINAKQTVAALNQLEEYERRGRVQLLKTDVLDTELMNYRGPHGEVAREKSARLPEDIGTLVLDHSRLDHARLAGDSEVERIDSLCRALLGRPLEKLSINPGERRTLRDVMHLYTHIVHQRDFFVTLEQKLHRPKRKGVLFERYGVRIGSPAECVAFVEKQVGLANSLEGGSE